MEMARGRELVGGEFNVSKDNERGGVGREKTEKFAHLFKKLFKGTRREVDDNEGKVDHTGNCNCIKLKGGAVELRHGERYDAPSLRQQSCTTSLASFSCSVREIISRV